MTTPLQSLLGQILNGCSGREVRIRLPAAYKVRLSVEWLQPRVGEQPLLAGLAHYLCVTPCPLVIKADAVQV